MTIDILVPYDTRIAIFFGFLVSSAIFALVRWVIDVIQ